MERTVYANVRNEQTPLLSMEGRRAATFRWSNKKKWLWKKLGIVDGPTKMQRWTILSITVISLISFMICKLFQWSPGITDPLTESDIRVFFSSIFLNSKSTNVMGGSNDPSPMPRIARP